ncbi:penicillin-binding protein 1C [Amaricoccus sp.]|uniref:penicillin-binding protein 1C n=1 Tax=Amaricoccus sp. TaxID=1872485 RepID=UPI002632BE5E|nr:penicillin-binding protein 1C [Amaricoccus sp.]HRO12283.1 penicillin-binding protein 1C [Amaricoccus sp.]
MTRGLAAVLAALALAAGALVWLDRWIDATVLPPLVPKTSAVVLDRHGTLLSAYTVADGRWRLPVPLDAVDRGYLAQLVAFEDRRFRSHPGVDPLALARAAARSLAAGRIVSGGSTLTMQVARLLEEGPTGTLSGKLRQIRVALALERRLDKDAILSLYLTLAPYGGNLEGIRAASLAWLGKEPRRLTPAEAALLVALPQSPEARRPDRAPEAARVARDRVLARAAAAGALDATEASAARTEPVPTLRRPFPALAPHLADRLVAVRPGAGEIATTLDAGLQSRLEILVAERARVLGPGISAALIVADHRTGEIRARIGAADRLDPSRGGFVDMSRAVRSPGSTLKPLVYGLAFEAGIAHPETVIEDRPMRFGSYAPQNLDRTWLGPITARIALQASRNLPAVALLDAVGPAQLMARLRRAGASPQLPPGGGPGLAIALGGVGLTLEDLVRLYAAIADGGTARPLAETSEPAPAAPARVLDGVPAWYVADILRGTPPPPNGVAGRIAYKTGTSYGHRDAWAIGFDGAHVVGVWFGRPDGAPVPGALGIEAAAPALFDAFARLAPEPVALPPPPAGALTVTTAELPAPLSAFQARGAADARGGPEIAFPPEGARVDLGLGRGAGRPLAIRLGAGVPPFRWLVDGAPIPVDPFARQAEWRPDGVGFVDLAVIDATGRTARTSVFLQ